MPAKQWQDKHVFSTAPNLESPCKLTTYTFFSFFSFFQEREIRTKTSTQNPSDNLAAVNPEKKPEPTKVAMSYAMPEASWMP